jgi:hypothetical protein
MEDYRRYIYFYTKDSTGTYTTSGYSLPITPFTFIPVFDDGMSAEYSKQNIYWDFGDGTMSQEITAVHHYAMPGWYNVKCYVLGKKGIGYLSNFSQNILVKDFISDTITISATNNKTQAGIAQNPFIVYRFNSWQTYNALSAEGYTIKLSMTGNNAPLLHVPTYNKDKWGHLKPSARFESDVYNNYTEKYDRTPIDSFQTTNNEIYVRNYNNEIVLCNKNDDGACFAGTSGQKVIYFIDDMPKTSENLAERSNATIFVTFDTKKFKDNNNYNKSYPENIYTVLNDVNDITTFSVIIQQLNPDHITITTNGIDDDNNGNRIHTFDIYPQKFTNQKIPFVAKIKQVDGYPSKYNEILKMVSNSNVNFGLIYLELRDSKNVKLTDALFYENLGPLSSETHGGYFKGYLIYDKPVNDVRIIAKSVPFSQEFYLVDTTYAIIPEPQSQYAHDLRIQNTNTDTKEIIENELIEVEGLSGIYSCCVTSNRTDGGVETYIWFVDSDREQLKKYDPNSKIFWDITLPENSSPSNICSDSKGNVWVSLYDSISTIKINNITNLEETDSSYQRIVSSLINEEIDYDYTITPASVDTDTKNNVWVSYSNELSSFIEKYDSNGNYIFRKTITEGYQCTEIITDLNSNLWGIAKDNITQTKVLSQKNDKVFKIDSTGSNIEYYEVGGSLWNITTDVYKNIWVTKNINQVSKINYISEDIYNFSIPTTTKINNLNYISDFEGIACTTDNTILIIDNTNKKIHYFSGDVDNSNFYPKSLNFSSVDINENYVQRKLNGYGDWNGFRHINKFQHKFVESKIVEGESNVFSIYNASSGKYTIDKKNEDFNALEQIKSYRFQEYLLGNKVLFDDFIGTAVGTISSRNNNLGIITYEKIANFTDNIANVDTCNIKALKSMYEMMDEDLYVFNNYNYSLPAYTGNLVDLFSINYTTLKGSRNKFDLNFYDKGYNNDDLRANGLTPIYGINKGKQLDFFTAILTGGKDIIAYEKYSETYRLLNTNILSSSYITFKNPTNKTYALSTYNHKWGWGLVLPDDFVNEHIPRYYNFYEYISGFDNNQTEGLINWSSRYTTISENITSVSEWNEVKQNLIHYSLAKGLGIIK